MGIDQLNNTTAESLLPSLIYIQFQMYSFIYSFKKYTEVYDAHFLFKNMSFLLYLYLFREASQDCILFSPILSLFNYLLIVYYFAPFSHSPICSLLPYLNWLGLFILMFAILSLSFSHHTEVFLILR